MIQTQRDITRTFFAVIFIGTLIGTSLWILRPFLGAMVWAATISTATWPFMLSMQKRLFGRRGLAVSVMTIVLLCILVLPLWMAISTIVANADRITGWVKALSTLSIPPPPAWLASIPIVGANLTSTWEKIGTAGMHEIVQKLAPYGGKAIGWFIAKMGSYGVLVLQFLLTVIFSAIFYARGEGLADWAKRFGYRLAGAHGENSVRLAGQALRGVALGVGVTALAQTAMGCAGLFIAGVPFAAILTAILFMLAIAQVGPILVMVPAVIWLYWSGSSGWGTFLLLWSLVVCTMDNFMRPILIKKGADLPLLLIFTGVIGGLTAFGIIGIFIGPVVLAVSHTLLTAWIDEKGDGRDDLVHQESL